MSTADYIKLAFAGPSGSHDELLTRLANEIYRSPIAGVGPGLNLGGPGLGGFGASPGAVTTAAPKPLFEPTAARTGMPAGPPAELTAAQSALPTHATHAGPSAGGAGVSPGAATTSAPTLEPSPAGAASTPAPANADPLDELAASALGGPVYTGPSLSGVGTTPGAGPYGGSKAATPAVPTGSASSTENNPHAPQRTPTAPSVGALGLTIPGEAELLALLSPISAGSPAATAPSPSGSQFYFLDHAAANPAGGRVSPVASPSGAPVSQYQSAHPAFDVNQIRRDFPILQERVNGRPLIWLDNAATTQKPKAVIDRLAHFYEHENSNIHRAAHELAARATDAYEGAREKVARFLGANSAEEIVFVRGATEAINLVAASWGGQNVGEGDEIVVTHLEHHANIVPWQQLARAKGANLRVVPVDDRGQVILEEYGKLLGPKTRIVAFTQVSNALGTVTPVKQMVEMARRVGARVLLDGAQAVSHMPVNVQELDADFYVLSGHKLFAPTGIGVLYGKKDLLDSMPPYQTGGNMISDVTFENTTFHGAPQRFEAGTGNIADAVGLGAAIDYIERIGLERIGAYEHELIVYATKLLYGIPGLRIVGTAPEKAGVVSFVLKGVPTELVGAQLNSYGIAVRSGHHCAQPILRRFGLESTVRPSFAFYNTHQEIDALASAVERIRSEAGQKGL